MSLLDLLRQWYTGRAMHGPLRNPVPPTVPWPQDQPPDRPPAQDEKPAREEP